MISDKLGKTPFEAILHHLPKGYTNTFLSQFLELNQNVVLEVEVRDYKNLKTTARALCFVPKFHCEIEMLIFHAKPYHKSIFKIDSELIVGGKLQKNAAGFYTLLQPKVLKNTDGIVLNFGFKGVKEKSLREFAAEITLESLQEFYSQVPLWILESLVEIYHPNEKFVQDFTRNHGFFGKSLEAIKFVEIYEYMRILRSKKLHFPSLASLNGEIESWIQTLPFKLTKGQSNAIREIQESLKSNQSARRVIVGDVGCGKTLVILASVMIAYPHRSVLMAPTSILAKQLFNEAKNLLPKSLKVALLTQNDRSGDLAQSDFVIGTHALLYQDLSHCALVMIDEQHRFGTAQRNALEKMFACDSRRAHILQFSATPIPRTQAMIESNFLDFSFIRDLPFKKDITTKVIYKNDFKNLLEHIKAEIQQKHQIIIVYPLVEESENSNYTALKEGEEFWRKNFENVYSTHGKDKNKEQVLEEFRECGNILLATTVIEVGISLPNLSTIVIVGAERLGLATLHQLRGRVSRNGLRGYCFLFTKQKETERLRRFCQTQNGFEIAQMDLEYRNSGDLLSGEVQSGRQFHWVNLGSDERIIKEAKNALDS
ncbi:ATP-dependent DNA helicase RecG [Helicobacter sp.]|uniref:ATP-dependent DNA helicase RecG n=1 Tax=Helicobacter sp. TaxID=218 RepID=UPI0019AE3DC4|nr:ATP-dependent DNA helicase RecG [Helicobacter sp.]MBD5166057.1 ATP-dependent DNA helicase RecG [Helicobacter sp.]